VKLRSNKKYNTYNHYESMRFPIIKIPSYCSPCLTRQHLCNAKVAW